MAIEILHPDAENPQPPWGYHIWVASAGNKVDCVAAQDATYIYVTAQWQYQGFALEDTNVSSGQIINNLTQYARALGQSDDENFRMSLYINGSMYDGADKALTSSYAQYNEVWLTNPDDSQVWESTDIDALYMMIHSRAGTGNWRCDHFWAEVDYTASSSSSSSQSISSSSSSGSVSTSFSSSSESISASSSSSSCSLDPTMVYSRGDYAALPGADANLETVFTCPEYPKVSADDNIYVQQTASDEYILFLWKNQNDDNKSAIIVTWKGKSDRAPNLSTVFLQIYNRNTPVWENLASNNVAGADVEFILLGSKIANLSHYYDAQNWVSCRVYQQAA